MAAAMAAMPMLPTLHGAYDAKVQTPSNRKRAYPGIGASERGWSGGVQNLCGSIRRKGEAIERGRLDERGHRLADGELQRVGGVTGDGGDQVLAADVEMDLDARRLHRMNGGDR